MSELLCPICHEPRKENPNGGWYATCGDDFCVRKTRGNRGTIARQFVVGKKAPKLNKLLSLPKSKCTICGEPTEGRGARYKHCKKHAHIGRWVSKHSLGRLHADNSSKRTYQQEEIKRAAENMRRIAGVS